MNRVQPDTSLTAKQATQLYTAIISQTGTAAPIAIVLQNTVGAGAWTRTGTGEYNIQFTDVSDTKLETIYCPTCGDFASSGTGWIPLNNGTGVQVGQYTLYYIGADQTIAMSVTNAAGAATDLNTLIGHTKISLPEIKIFN